MGIKIYDVRSLPGDSAFLADDGDTALLYDTGFGFTGDAVAANVKAILGERKLSAILLTHSHYDHALGTPYVLKHFPEAKVVAGEYAAKIFAKPTAKALMRELDLKFASRCGAEMPKVDLTDELRVDIAVCDGDKLRFGALELEAVALPGHTRCSVGYFLKSEDFLFSTESLGVYSEDGEVVPSYLVGYQMAMDSIERVEKMAPRRMLVPHYGVIEGGLCKEYLKGAKHSAQSAKEDIVAMLKAGKTKEEAMEYFKARFFSSYVEKIYPVDAMLLNTSIKIDLLKREFVD